MKYLRSSLVAALLPGMFALLFLGGCGRVTPPSTIGVSGTSGSTATTTESASTTITSSISESSSTSNLPRATTTTIFTHAIGSPTRIVIPGIKVDAQVVPVGIDKDGGMEVPKVGVTGWYKLGPAPGASGPAVIVAHVSYGGVRGAFYNLKKLQAGDQVLIYDAVGDCAAFQVDSLETILKSRLPTERIWNDTQDSVIRLITCGGRYDPQTKHYLSNVIVYGHLVQ